MPTEKYSGKELMASISEMGVMKLNIRLQALASNIYEKTLNSDLSDERKEQNYALCQTLLDAKKMIDDFVRLDSTRMSNNFTYIAKIKQIDEELKQLREENNYLKSQIPLD